ncbi:MAG: GH25 family lysozyme [Roseburia sp.]
MSKWFEKFVSLVCLVAVLTTGIPLHIQAAEGEWKEDDTGRWYQYSDGSYACNKWENIDEKWYYFNASGYLVTGWYQLNGTWYYSDSEGVMQTGLQTITNDSNVTDTYYFSSTGEMLTGWQKLPDGSWKYFTLSGSKQGAMVEDSSYQNNSVKGIDVSKYQGDINWNKVWAEGIDFAFVRIGHGTRVLDPYYKQNMEGANNAGIATGVYFYSTATDAAQSVLDAQWVIDNLAGYPVSYPVAIDLEDWTTQGSKLSKTQITQIAKAFCDEIRKAGYTPMIYCNEAWYKDKIDFSAVGDVEVWVARYNYIYDKDITRDIWQGGSTTRLDGISGNVDIDFAFTNYRNVITPRTGAVSTYVKSTGVWEQDDLGTWYHYLAGGYPANKWECIEGTWYWFDAKGYRGIMTGWYQLGDSWYYYQTDGTPATDWQKIGGEWYYFDKSSGGKMLYGWQLLNGKWYYLGSSASDGAMKTGWQYINNKWYYFDTTGDGKMLTDWQKIDGKWYYFDTTGDGKMLYGWQYINGKWYYLSDSASDGSMKTGWQYINSKWYYMDTTGDGCMLTGWNKIDGKWYYMDTTGDGRMLTGWQEIDGKWYYFNKSGAMAENTWIGNYYVDGNGVWVKSK